MEEEEIPENLEDLFEEVASEIPKNLGVHPVGDVGDVSLMPALDNKIKYAKLPCNIPLLMDADSEFESHLDDPEKLPVHFLNNVQKYIPVEIHEVNYFMDLFPSQTYVHVERDVMTGKVFGFSEKFQDMFQTSFKTSTSLSRAPGPVEAGVKGSTSGCPFWPGGVDEPWADLIRKDDLYINILNEEMLDTPPEFEDSMKFEKKSYDEEDFIFSQPQKIDLSDVLAMDAESEIEEPSEFEENKDEEVDLEKAQLDKQPEIVVAEEDSTLKASDLPVLNISQYESKEPVVHYEWAVIDSVTTPIDDFNERLPNMAYKWGFELDIFQKRAILHLEKRENVFVAAHTSAGKTVVAEYAVALAKQNHTRVIYTSPIKALSNQKYRDFKKVFEDVGLITGDIQINSTAFCLIMTTEILRSMLYHGSDIVRELEWVIFDEVHYINDSERGVVWEEVFIMLPDHVNLIMLSATVPNTAEFAEWLGGIKKRKIFVISTLKRPVPLEYYLYTGSVGKARNEIFPIVDSSKNFLTEKYSEALKAKKDKQSKFKATTGPKGPKYNITPAQEKNVYIGVLGYLEEKNLLPAVCFTFSRKKCNLYAEMLTSMDLTSNDEKHEIKKFFISCMQRLKSEDRKLPQVQLINELLIRGFGIHHSGILPILKEVVEMCFDRGLVKVLFATETFAMGVNMPARTVIFDSVRKHDGLNFRDLEPSEFIQMAGRAGRRGRDSIGTVILLCKGDVPEASVLHKMILGKPTKLRSQFKLTYNMILNLMKVRTLRVEDVMKRSFGESYNQQQHKKYQSMLTDASTKLSVLPKLECMLCNKNDDLEQYIIRLKETLELQKEVMVKKCSQALANKKFVPGLILVVSTNQRRNVPGILLSVNSENKCKVLVIKDKRKSSDKKMDGNTLPWTKKLFCPNEKELEVLDLTFSDVQVISNKMIKIKEMEVLKEWRKIEVGANPGHIITSAFQELCSLVEANINGFDSLIINFKDMTMIDKICKYEELENLMETFTCVKCPEFSKHFTELSHYMELEEEIRDFNFRLSERSLTLHPEYEIRKNILREMDYIDDEENVLLKGCVAREMNNHELLITELLVKSIFSGCEPEEVSALLSCMVFQQKHDDENLELTKNLTKKVQEIKKVALDISSQQSKNGINEPHFVDQYNFHLVHVVYEWAKGTMFSRIMQDTDIDEGIIVRTIQRLSELLKDVKKGASLIGDTSLAEKMEDAWHKIRRDIVFAASLYYQ